MKRLALPFSKNLKGITSKHDCDFYCLKCLQSFKTENKLKSHGKKKVKMKIFLKLQYRPKKIKYYNLINIS